LAKMLNESGESISLELGSCELADQSAILSIGTECIQLLSGLSWRVS
jgi:hypothetical protein